MTPHGRAAGHGRPPIEAVAVVVPVRNEEDRLERCLRAVARALDHVPAAVRTQVVIALDGCTDASDEIAAHWPFASVRLDSGGVGRARAAGIRAAVGALSGVRSTAIWLANTDADSEVPAEWLAEQLRLADAGSDVVLGTVVPDEDDLPAELRGLSAELRRPLLAHAESAAAPVYGANLGVRASRYERVGGFAAVHEHEDVRLVAALCDDGAAVTSAPDLSVLTSGRAVGRSPGGYAAYLREAAARAAAISGASAVIS